MFRKLQLIFYKLHYIFPRFKFWRICRVLGIKPYKWQRDFALGVVAYLQYPPGRATGKTTAVMLRLLMMQPYKFYYIQQTLANDPDFSTCDRRRVYWYDGEYKRLAHKCAKAHIPVQLSVNIFALCDRDNRH